MKAFIEDYGLNLLGDTVAGFLGLATFIVVVFTYFAQKAMAKHTADAMNAQVVLMKEQSELQRAVAAANIKQTWFEERFALYRYFKTAADELHDNISLENIRDLNEHALKVFFVFGRDVSKQGAEFFVLLSVLETQLRHHEEHYVVFPPYDAEGALPYSADDSENASIRVIETQIGKVWRELDGGPLIQAMEIMLELDEQIEFKPKKNGISDKTTTLADFT